MFVEARGTVLETGIITEKGEKKSCFAANFVHHGAQFSELHESYIFMAGRTESYFANGMYVNKARFKDTKHLHDDEEVDSEED